MKRLLFVGLLATALASCEQTENPYHLDGTYELDLGSKEEYGVLSPPLDTIYADYGIVKFMGEKMYTYSYSEQNLYVPQILPRIGGVFALSTEFDVVYTDSGVYIGLKGDSLTPDVFQFFETEGDNLVYTEDWSQFDPNLAVKIETTLILTEL